MMRCCGVPRSHTNASVMPAPGGGRAEGEPATGIYWWQGGGWQHHARWQQANAPSERPSGDAHPRGHKTGSHRQTATHPPRWKQRVSCPVSGCWCSSGLVSRLRRSLSIDRRSQRPRCSTGRLATRSLSGANTAGRAGWVQVMQARRCKKLPAVGSCSSLYGWKQQKHTHLYPPGWAHSRCGTERGKRGLSGSCRRCATPCAPRLRGGKIGGCACRVTRGGGGAAAAGPVRCPH